MKLILIILSFTALFTAKSQEVELVIASGLDWTQCVAISPNNRFVAKAIYNTTSIWDIKTGRMIRNVQYSDNLEVMTDSIWFSEDNSELIVSLVQSNDSYRVNITTGEVIHDEGPPMDWTNYKYVYSINTSSTMHLYSTSKKDLHYPSPDGKKEIIYKKIKNPLANNNVVPNAYEIHLKNGKKVSEPIDTVYAASFAFSQDSRFLFTNSKIYDLESYRLISELKMVPYCGSSIMFQQGNRIPVTAGINGIRIWDFPNIEDIHVENLVNFKTTTDGKFAMCERYTMLGGDKEFLKVDLEKKKIVGKSVSSDKSGFLLDMSADGERFCFLEMSKKNKQVTEMNYNIKIYESKSGKLVKNLNNSVMAFFTQDNNQLITDSAGSYNFRYLIKEDVMERFPTEKVDNGTSISGVSIDHKYMMGSTYESKNGDSYHSRVNAWDTETGKVIFETYVDGIQIDAYQVSKDAKLLSLATSNGNRIMVYDFKTGELIHQLKGHTSMILHTYFSDDGKRLISSSLDGTRRIWNLEDGTEMVSLITTGENDYAIVTPEQYYYATKGAQKLIHFVKGKQIYPFAQFDLKYNRPDIILESLQASNQDLIEPFYLAYQKRLKRTGYTEEMLDGEFHLPTAEITNSSKLPISTKSNKITLDITASDNQYFLDRLIVRVNEVPLFGKNGIDLKTEKTKSIEQKLDIELSSGNNNVSVSVMNEKGVESISSNLDIEYHAGDNTSNLYLFTIGVSKYEQNQYDLTYASKDADDMTSLFQGNNSPFTKLHNINITNEMVTLEAVLALKETLKETTVDDAVCIFFAGHGLLNANLDYYLASHDINFNAPEEKGIPYEVFENLMDDIPARKKLILIDACHSGEIDKEEVVMVEENIENESDLTFRAVTGTTVKTVGLSNSFELMKELFTDVRKSSGTMIISSAGGMEYAMEGADWNNGVFTYCLLNGLKNKKADLNNDGKILISEMNNYVREEVFKLTNGLQQPTNRAEIIEHDWRLW